MASDQRFAAPGRWAHAGHSIVVEGVFVGATGATVVALWFLVQDLGTGTPLRTPALLGAALFHGIRDPAMVHVTAPLVAAYTVVHVATYVAFGLAVAGLFAAAERQPRVLFAIFMLLCCGAVAFLAMVTVLMYWLVDALTLLAALAANMLAALAMGAVVLSVHRRVLRHARSAGE
jgi:hypothetical protein